MQCAWGYLASKDPTLLACVEHGVRFLLEHHKSASGGYAWELEVTGSGEVHRRDETNRESATKLGVLPIITPSTHTHTSPEPGSYAFAFVTSAFALALSCGVEAARAPLAEVGETWSSRLWEPAASLCACCWSRGCPAPYLTRGVSVYPNRCGRCRRRLDRDRPIQREQRQYACVRGALPRVGRDGRPRAPRACGRDR